MQAATREWEGHSANEVREELCNLVGRGRAGSVARSGIAKNRRDEAEADVRHLALVIGARTARMNELGGLLNFYAAAKLVSQKESE
jgi:hypothetical protein